MLDINAPNFFTVGLFSVLFIALLKLFMMFTGISLPIGI